MHKLTKHFIHISQLLNGCSEGELNKLRLVRDPAAYFYVGAGNCNRASSTDKSDYKTITTALSVLGFTQNEMQTIWNIVAGILHLVRSSCNNNERKSNTIIWFLILHLFS